MSHIYSNDYSAGTMFWFSLSGLKTTEEINASIMKHFGREHYEKYTIENRKPKSAFLKALRKTKDKEGNYLLRKIHQLDSRITVAVIKETKKDESHIDLNQQSTIILSIGNESSKLDYRCSCGNIIETIDSDLEILDSCFCGQSIPYIVSNFIMNYVRTRIYVDSNDLAKHVRNIMYSMDAIRMSQFGRPFFTPEPIRPDCSSTYKELSISNLLRAIKDWGDFVSVFPIMEEAHENVKIEAIRAFHDQIDKYNKILEDFDESTRDSTKLKRAQELDDIRKKVQLYSFVLEDAKEELEDTIEKVKERIISL